MASLSRGRQNLVTTTLSLGVEVGVGELPWGDVVEVSSEVGVLLGNEEDEDHVDKGETCEGPSDTHDTLFTSVSVFCGLMQIKKTYLGDTGALGNKRVSGAVVGVFPLVENSSGNDGTWLSAADLVCVNKDTYRSGKRRKRRFRR